MSRVGSAIRLVAWAAGLGGANLLAAQTTWTANPVADAFVTTGPSGNLTGNNYGILGALEISGSGAARTGVGFRGAFFSVMRFDLATAKGAFDAAYGAGLWSVQGVSLSLSTSAATGNALFNTNSAGQFSVKWVESDGWAEGTGATPADGITYATLPAFLGANDETLGTFSFDPAVSGAGGFASVYALALGSGLSSDVLAGGFASFELLAATNGVSYLVNSTNFSMRENRPLLTITAVAVPEPGAGWLAVAAIPGIWAAATRRRRARAAR